MTSMNKVILVGRLGANPEVRYFTNGDAVCNMSLATSSKWRDKTSGQMREITEWHRVVLYRQLAETASHYLRKGACICVEGRLRSRSWTDRDGKTRITAEVEASQMQMIGAGRTDEYTEPPASAAVVKHAMPMAVNTLDDDEPPF